MTNQEIIDLLKPKLLFAAKSAIWEVNKYYFNANHKEYNLLHRETLDQPISELLENSTKELVFLANISSEEYKSNRQKHSRVLEQEKNELEKIKADIHYFINEKEKIRYDIKLLKNKKEKEIREYEKQKRTKCAEIIKKIRIAENELYLINNLLTIHDRTYPMPPRPMFPASEYGENMPQKSGVYFVWETSIIAYVGQSINLNQRCRLGSHQKIQKKDWLSYLLFENSTLNHTEAFYIGMCRPLRNGAVR